MEVNQIDKSMASAQVVKNHYLHRRPSISYAYGLFCGSELVGVITIGVPASRHLQKGLCPSNPSKVFELNRLWVDDKMPRNTESWFMSRALALTPPMILCSYADTEQGHVGYVYRASNWYYSGWTDMDRKTPRYDYVVAGKHSRDAFRNNNEYTRVLRKPKYKYWTVTGSKRERKRLKSLSNWPTLDWKKLQLP